LIGVTDRRGVMSLTKTGGIRVALTGVAVLVILSLALSGFSLATVLSAPAHAVTVPNTVGFEGYLMQGGIPAGGMFDLTFGIFDADTGGELLWQEPHPSVPVSDGLYSVELGCTETLSAQLFDGARWIAVKVGDESWMEPRTKVSSVPFALNADAVRGLDPGTSGADAHLVTTDDSGSTTVSGGLNLGTAAGAAQGDLYYSGDLRAFRGATSHVGHVLIDYGRWGISTMNVSETPNYTTLINKNIIVPAGGATVSVIGTVNFFCTDFETRGYMGLRLVVDGVERDYKSNGIIFVYDERCATVHWIGELPAGARNIRIEATKWNNTIQATGGRTFLQYEMYD
jgi:hypothetical protein